MTVSMQVSRNEYTGNGATTQYDFTFRIMDKSDLLVQTLDASETITTLTLDADYSVTGVNRYPGGKVVLNTPLPDGYKISIERSIPVTQETSIRNQGGFFPEIHEDAFDKLTMLVQQVYGWWSGLALKKPSWLANYYDAMNNRIRNLRDPSQAQDAATKGYTDSADSNLQQQITDNFQKTLRVPEGSIPVITSVSSRRNSIFGWDSNGKQIPVFSMTETADLAIKLASHEPGLGANLVDLEGAGTVYDALTRVNVLRFGADPTGRSDSSAAARKARDFAVARGINELYFPAGWDYVCADYIEDIYLPGDDGTVNPAWVGVNGDVNIAPELQYKAKTFCRLPRGMRITGDGKHATRIRGNWNNASSTIPTTIGDVPASAGYGFFWSNNNNKSAANGHGIVGVTLAQYFVARGGDGIMVESLEDDLIIEDCYFSGIFQGAERCKSHWLEEKRIYAPTIVGGHWLQRNNTQTVSQLPPYPATDAWTLGWCDAWTYGTHHHTQYQGVWGSRHVDGDKFFDNMYFKSRNTLTYANGGRLSNNSNNPASIPKWEGVVGRARVLLSRYGRQINSNGTDFFKSMGEHRTPYYCATPGGNNVIHDCFLEAIGLVDNRMAAGGGNYFGIAVPDPLNPGQSGIGYMVGVGGIQLANYTTSARLQHAPLVSSTNRLYGSQQYVNFVKVATDNFEMERRSVWDGSNTTIKYQRNNNDCFSQPIAFSLGGEKLNYSVLSFTPGITIGGVANSSLTGNGYLVKTGRQLVMRCRFTASSALDLPTGAVKITGLPYSIPNNIYGISFGFAYCPQLVNSISVFTRVGDVATEINLIKDSKGTALDGDDFSTTQAIFLWVEMTATILE